MQIPKLICFDVGARNGLQDLGGLSSHINLFSFEPNINANDSLPNKKTFYSSFEIIQKALYNKSGTFDFHIMKNPSMSSLLLPDEKILDEYFNSIKEFKTWRKQLTVCNTTKIETITIDAIVNEKNIGCIDYLKLDTQGTELAILQGAEKCLKEQRILVIKTEFAFIPLYKDQPTFTNIDLFLKAAGYKLITCDFKYDAIYPTNKYSEAPKWGIGGDAYYCLDLEKTVRGNEDKVLKTAVILAGLGFLSNSDHIFNHLKIERSEQIKLYNKILKRNKRSVIKYFVPSFVIGLFKKIALKKA